MPIQVPLHDSERCKHVTSNGKDCYYKQVKGESYCEFHVHMYVEKYTKQFALKSYQLSSIHIGAKRHLESSESKGLLGEVALARLALEKLFNSLNTEWDFQVHTPRIESLVNTITKAVSAAERLERTQGRYLDADNAMIFIDEVSKIIAEEIKDETVIVRISTKIGEALESAKHRAVEQARLEPDSK